MKCFLGLMGGAEFREGCEPFDRALLAAARLPRVHLLAAAAARQNPELAERTARNHYARLGAEVLSLQLLKRGDAGSAAAVAGIEEAACIFICGGDPGHLLRTLEGTRAWAAIEARWRGGMPLAGSSAGAMVLAQWMLSRAGWPAHAKRRWVGALGLVPASVVLPHYAEFGHRWLPSAREDGPPGISYLGLEECSGIIWEGAAWRAVGPAPAVLIRGDSERVLEPGSAVPIDPPA